jgi:hypothetical protein
MKKGIIFGVAVLSEFISAAISNSLRREGDVGISAFDKYLTAGVDSIRFVCAATSTDATWIGGFAASTGSGCGFLHIAYSGRK